MMSFRILFISPSYSFFRRNYDIIANFPDLWQYIFLGYFSVQNRILTLLGNIYTQHCLMMLKLDAHSRLTFNLYLAQD